MPPQEKTVCNAGKYPHSQKNLSYREQVLELYKAQVPTNTDLDETRHERLFRVDCLRPYVLPLLADERDFIAVELFVNMVLVLAPLFVAFCWYPSHIFGVLFAFFRLKLFGQRFMLTLHIVSHRKLFKDDNLFGKVLNRFPETIFAVAMGLPPGGYYIHHVMMHHCENNLFPYDITSTMPFQRDTMRGLIGYVAMYFTAGVFFLPYYALRKRRFTLLAMLIPWMAIYYVVLPSMISVYPLQIMYLIVIPWFVLGWYIMAGNFSQHMFVCPNDPRNNYKLSYMIVNCPQSKYNYNDGYHLTHHLNSRLHWSELPTHFLTNIEEFARNDATIFKDIDTKQVMNLVFAQDYETLYESYVQIRPNTRRTLAEFETMIRDRLVPIPLAAYATTNKDKSG